MCSIQFLSCKSREKKVGPEPDKIVFINPDLSNTSNNLITLIRDEKLSKSSSQSRFNSLLKEIKTQYDDLSPRQYNSNQWVFPLKGYNTDISLGSSKDEGYVPGRYDFFDGNSHKGHPALDIFINDYNQDCIDDKTAKSINVLSMTEGVVLAAEMKWDTSSTLRGGKYIWIYDPSNQLLLYYAHNNTINIKPGQVVKPGDIIATCGRTGLNAFMKRSPTHLHLMVLKISENNYPKPINPYNYIKNAKTL